MTMNDKKNLVADVEERIGNYLTVVQTRNVVGDLNEALESYSVEEADTGELNYDLLEMFLRAKSVEGKSQKTIERYRYIITQMHEYVGKNAGRICTDDIRGYLAKRQETVSGRTVEGERSCLSSYFSWLWKEQIISSNPVGNITTVKYQKKIYPAFTEVEIEKLKNACTSLRDKALIMFLYRTGARISEACALNKDDIVFEGNTCKVLGKGNKEREVYFTDLAAEILKEYLNSRTDNSPALFPGRGTDRMTEHGFQKMFRQLGKRAGVPDTHAHRFRRTLATELDRKGMSIKAIQKILGHENISTTAMYISLTNEDVHRAYNGCM